MILRLSFRIGLRVWGRKQVQTKPLCLRNRSGFSADALHFKWKYGFADASFNKRLFCLSVCVCGHMCVCVCTYVCMYVCMYVCI